MGAKPKNALAPPISRHTADVLAMHDFPLAVVVLLADLQQLVLALDVASARGLAIKRIHACHQLCMALRFLEHLDVVLHGHHDWHSYGSHPHYVRPIIAVYFDCAFEPQMLRRLTIFEFYVDDAAEKNCIETAKRDYRIAMPYMYLLTHPH